MKPHFLFMKQSYFLDSPDTYKIIPTELSKSAAPAPVLPVTYNWPLLWWAIIGVGIFLRLFHLFDNRSLWNDEVFLTSSLLKTGFIDLVSTPLDYQQKAPIGFLWVVRLLVLLLGKSEMVLRLFSLLCGIASLFVFVPVARYFLKPTGVAIALAILAIAPPVIYHAVEIKQYSADLLATIVILWLYIRYHARATWQSLLQWGLLGFSINLFSYSAIFILAGMAGSLGLWYIYQNKWSLLFRSVPTFFMWLAGFVVSYYLLSYKYPDSEWLMIYFRNEESFMPLLPTSLTEVSWFLKKLFSIVHYPLGLDWTDRPPAAYNVVLRTMMRMVLLPVLFLSIGLVYFFRKDKQNFMVLTFPIVLTLLASAFEFYPVLDRLILFWSPLLIILIAQGCYKSTNFISTTNKWRYVLPFLLLAPALANSAIQVVNPALFGGWKKSFQRESLFYIKDKFKPGDIVYVYWNNVPNYRVYQDMYNLKLDAVEGSDVRFISQDVNDFFKKLEPDYKHFSGKKRVWLIHNKLADVNMGDIPFKPDWYFAKVAETEIIRDKFSELGKLIDSYQTSDVNVYLYDLTAK